MTLGCISSNFARYSFSGRFTSQSILPSSSCGKKFLSKFTALDRIISAGAQPIDECIIEFSIRATNGKYHDHFCLTLKSNTIVLKCRNTSLFALSTIVFSSSSTLRTGSLGLYVNTTGHEVVEEVKNEKLYIPISERVINRLFYKFNAEQFDSPKDFILGIGVYGGGGVFQINNPATYHNSYLDIYTMGGIYFLFVTILILIFNLYYLLINFLSNRNELAIILIISNSVLFFNMLFFNGAIFHPLISFSFWISLVYLFKYNELK